MPDMSKHDWRAHLRDRDGLELGAILTALQASQEIVRKALDDKSRPDWLEVADLYDSTSDRIAEIEHIIDLEEERALQREAESKSRRPYAHLYNWPNAAE